MFYITIPEAGGDLQWLFRVKRYLFWTLSINFIALYTFWCFMAGTDSAILEAFRTIECYAMEHGSHKL